MCPKNSTLIAGNDTIHSIIVIMAREKIVLDDRMLIDLQDSIKVKYGRCKS